ncbi:MAG TPA: hypothetical protein VE078_10265 [Thermoanaerobaculia bacterium]|nr:hypothetical protein [Thermoanaerobaculia bacterium]
MRETTAAPAGGRRRQAVRCSVFLGSLLLGGCASAAHADPRYALGEIAVSGGNPINQDGIIYQRQFDSECRMQPPSRPFSPVSAYLGANLVLKLTVIACPLGSPPPSTTCEVGTGGGKGTVSFTGWTADLPVPLPLLTGIDRLQLSCTVQQSPAEQFRTELYMTWRKSLLFSGTPRVKWYQKACAWGANLDATKTEAEVMESLLNGLYEYGQRHWRYGYGTGSPCLFCAGPGSPCQCPCSWSNLVEDDPCNFGDCFVFSAVLQNMAGLMGLLASLPNQIEGAHNLGFLTRPSFRAIDPAFPGNAKCDPREVPCSYLFPTHGVSSLHDVVYDATFGRSYPEPSAREPSALIAQNVTEPVGQDRVLERNVACFTGLGYGGWPFYIERPLLPDCAIDATSPVRFTRADAKVKPVSLHGDERPEVLGVFLEVEAEAAGTYFVGGSLYAEGEPVSHRPLDMIQLPTLERVVARTRGPHTVRLLFSGEKVLASAKERFTLHAWLASAKGRVETREIALPQVPFGELAQLGERPVRFYQTVNVVVDSEVRKNTALHLKVPIVVREAGEILLQGALSSSARTIATAGWSGHLPRGEHTLEQTLELDSGPELTKQALQKEKYEITLALQWGDPPTPVDWCRLRFAGALQLRDAACRGTSSANEP